ncbi:MAG: DUF342 domain-containing protein [Lachnospiraceae bacterium]|nr:DUF342 domain-containing protein [Lachnospiraceae bacterium]
MAYSPYIEDTNYSLNEIIVDISRDSLIANVEIITDGSYELTETELYEFLYAYELAESRIDKELVSDIVKRNRFNVALPVAQGIAPVDGVDGYFEYFFTQTDVKPKPLILDDGSVDYSSVNFVGTVSVGDKIACYHPPVKGTPGIDVYGQEIPPKEGRDYPTPSLRNCKYNPDNKCFYALKEGRVNASTGRIEVIEEMQINSDVNSAYGNIDFIGNIVINGNVEEGVEIRASADIIINGLVQNACIYAGGDITIDSGIHGGKNCKIECGGTLTARFIEHAKITAHMNVISNYILSCKIHAGNSIIVNNGVGIIAGGKLYAGFKIDANRIGNKQGIDTWVTVGLIGDEETKAELAQIDIDETYASIPTITEKEEKLYAVENKNDDVKHRLQSVRRELVREYIKQSLATYTLANIRNQEDKDKPPRYIMAKTMYTGAVAFIDTKQYPVTFDQSDIILKSGEDDSNEEQYFR